MRGVLVGTAFVALVAAGLTPATTSAAQPAISSQVTLSSAARVPNAEVRAVLDDLAPGEVTTVIVTLREQVDLGRMRGGTRAARLSGTIRELMAKATTTQAPLRALLHTRERQGKVAHSTPLWVANAISVTATADVIRELAARADVASVTPDQIVVVPATGSTEPNVDTVGAPALWELGSSGQGVVVASLDTGVDVSHPDLTTRWRGGTDSWYDPYGEHPSTPTDVSGHGTATMGAIVGGDAGGSAIGVAPGARWIAAKIFNDRGAATATAIHLAFQWVLDPDHDPSTADAPQVVNGSWSIGTGPGCDLSFQPDVQALRAAGILPVFAAGNYGSGGSSSVSPANYPETLSVGAVNSNDVILSSSSRGPSTCGGRARVFPDVVAPGFDIRTADLHGQYQIATGTSMAAPHATGAAALLLGGVPSLTAAEAQSALTDAARDLGLPGPDPVYGNGRLDALAASGWLRGQQDFAVALTPGVASSTPGGSVTFDIQVTRAYGFPGDVTLTLSGLSAAQANWTFAPLVLSRTTAASKLVVTTFPAVPPGSYPLTVTATSSTISRTVGATLTVTAPAVTDTVGPSTTSPTLTPSVTNGTVGASLHAAADDTSSGNSLIAAAEFFIDTAGADGGGAAMTVGAAAPAAGVDAVISAATVAGLSDGVHTISVHAKDAAGNWGVMATTTLLVDKGKPVISGVTATPNPTLGADTVNLTAQATDALTAVNRAEWFTGTDPGLGSATPMAITGTGPWTLSANAINIANWNEGAYTLTVRARDAAGNWSANTTTVLQVRRPLSFSTAGSSNPPGVTGTADDADIYSWNGTAFSRTIDVTTAPYSLPGGANVDGFDRASATTFYLSFTDQVNLPGLTNVQDEDVVFFNGTTWSLFFDGSAHGLGNNNNLDLDAISITGTTLYFSTLGNTNPPLVGGTADDADIYSWNGAVYARVIDASAAPYTLPTNANTDGFVRIDASHFYLSFSATTTTVPVLGTVQDEDIIYNNAGTWSTYFDGTTHALTTNNLDIDAFDIP